MFKTQINKANTTNTYVDLSPTSSWNAVDCKSFSFTEHLLVGENRIRIFLNNTNQDNAAYSFQRMGDALINTRTDVVYSIDDWGQNEPWDWAQPIAQAWRTTNDVSSSAGSADWATLMSVYEHNVGMQGYSSSNAFNDADYLCVGLKNMDNNKDQSNMALWSIMMSPLMIGADVRSLSFQQ